jgi:hypothetical protein
MDCEADRSTKKRATGRGRFRVKVGRVDFFIDANPRSARKSSRGLTRGRSARDRSAPVQDLLSDAALPEDEREAVYAGSVVPTRLREAACRVKGARR